MLRLVMTDQAMAEYKSWVAEGNLKIVDKIDALIEDAQRDPRRGLGKPEPLRYGLSGKWSRRISKADRLVYSVDDDRLVVHQCRGHYQ